VLRGRRLAPGRVGVLDGAFVAPGHRRPRRLPEGWIVAAGMVDLQVNGYAGLEVGSDPEAIAGVAAALPSGGVTAFCPTLVSRGDRAYARAARAIARAPWRATGARSLGVHLEGPFLSDARPGAHPPAALRDPTRPVLDDLVARFAPRIVTLAPERSGGLDAVRVLARRGVLVSLGHTEADAAVALAAFDSGARLLTHAFNAMPGILSREPSALVAALGDRRARVTLIADGVHVAPAVAALVARLAGPRLVLISDAVAPTAAPPGRYRLGERTVRSDGVSVRGPDGQLAGSAAPLWRGPVVLAEAGIPRAAALHAACEAPRAALGLGPGLTPGDAADLVLLDADLVPRLTVVAGRVAWADPALPFDVPGPGHPLLS
jgi:N-acetylglucosamine-6-phosphate deacetylase